MLNARGRPYVGRTARQLEAVQARENAPRKAGASVGGWKSAQPEA